MPLHIWNLAPNTVILSVNNLLTEYKNFQITGLSAQIQMLLFVALSKLKEGFALREEAVQPQEGGGCQLLPRGWAMLEWVVGHLVLRNSSENLNTSAAEKGRWNFTFWTCPGSALQCLCLYILVTSHCMQVAWKMTNGHCPFCWTLKSHSPSRERQIDETTPSASTLPPSSLSPYYLKDDHSVEHWSLSLTWFDLRCHLIRPKPQPLLFANIFLWRKEGSALGCWNHVMSFYERGLGSRCCLSINH